MSKLPVVSGRECVRALEKADFYFKRQSKIRERSNPKKSVYAGLVVELKGRVGNFEPAAKVTGSQSLVGQIVLEALDLVVDPRTRTLIPNPRSPETPMVEIF